MKFTPTVGRYCKTCKMESDLKCRERLKAKAVQ